MRLRDLGTREVCISYDVPLKRESQFSKPYADPRTIAIMGHRIQSTSYLISCRYHGRVRVNAQLDAKEGFGEFDEPVVNGFELSVGFDRVDKEKVPMKDLEDAVRDFIRQVPFKPSAGVAPSNLFKEIEQFEPEHIFKL